MRQQNSLQLASSYVKLCLGSAKAKSLSQHANNDYTNQQIFFFKL